MLAASNLLSTQFYNILALEEAKTTLMRFIWWDLLNCCADYLFFGLHLLLFPREMIPAEECTRLSAQKALAPAQLEESGNFQALDLEDREV